MSIMFDVLAVDVGGMGLDVLGLLSPESIAILNRTLMKICILNHVVS